MNRAYEIRKKHVSLMKDFYWVILIEISLSCFFAQIFFPSSMKIFHVPECVCVCVCVCAYSDCLELIIWHVKRMCHVENIKYSLRIECVVWNEWNKMNVKTRNK